MPKKFAGLKPKTKAQKAARSQEIAKVRAIAESKTSEDVGYDKEARAALPARKVHFNEGGVHAGLGVMRGEDNPNNTDVAHFPTDMNSTPVSFYPVICSRFTSIPAMGRAWIPTNLRLKLPVGVIGIISPNRDISHRKGLIFQNLIHSGRDGSEVEILCFNPGSKAVQVLDTENLGLMNFTGSISLTIVDTTAWDKLEAKKKRVEAALADPENPIHQERRKGKTVTADEELRQLVAETGGAVEGPAQDQDE